MEERRKELSVPIKEDSGEVLSNKGSGNLPGQTKSDVYYSRNPSPVTPHPNLLPRVPEPVRGLTAKTALQPFSQGQRLNFFPVLHHITLPIPLPFMEVGVRVGGLS